MKAHVKTAIATLGICWLLPSLIDLFYSVQRLLELIAVFSEVKSAGQGDPKLMASVIAGHLIRQVLAIIFYLPGIVALSIAVFKFNMCSVWFKYSLRLLGLVLLLNLQLVSVLGLYVLFLSVRVSRYS